MHEGQGRKNSLNAMERLWTLRRFCPRWSWQEKSLVLFSRIVHGTAWPENRLLSPGREDHMYRSLCLEQEAIFATLSAPYSLELSESRSWSGSCFLDEVQSSSELAYSLFETSQVLLLQRAVSIFTYTGQSLQSFLRYHLSFCWAPRIFRWVASLSQLAAAQIRVSQHARYARHILSTPHIWENHAEHSNEMSLCEDDARITRGTAS